MDSDVLPLSRATLDRDARRRTQGIEAILAEGPTRVIAVREGRIAATATNEVDVRDAVEHGMEAAYLGCDDEGNRYVADLGLPGAPASGAAINVRDVGWQLSARDAGLCTTAIGLANWHASNRFCAHCGAPTTIALAGWERHCSADARAHYPRTDPAVIMAITDDDDRLLLGHSAPWPDLQYSVPAGFVEPGESLEAAVRREVHEETAIVVGDVTYAGSQPWPFPASIMLGFTGRALTFTPQPDGVEMTDAMFVSRADVARLLAAEQLRLPRPTSIAHHLIAQWYGAPLPSQPNWA